MGASPMSLQERLNEIARQAQQDRRGDIERLLAENAGKLLRASDLQQREKQSSEPALPLLDIFTGSTRITNERGTLLCVTSDVPVHAGGVPPHPRGYFFAPEPTRPLPDAAAFGKVIAFLGNDEALADIVLERLAFLDLETTGLSGSSGTYPFLIGLGYFRGDDTAREFVCEQYFMEDYSQEEAVLTHLLSRLEEFDGFVTFNGKTFDLPLLGGRLIMNRMRADLERPHLDLLHVARSLYRSRLGGCALGNIERHVLQLERSHDIEGHLVPRIYFDYLNGKWPERLVPVFDHNAQDVISMGSLLLLCIECAFDPAHPFLEHAHDVASLGRLHRKRGESGMAIELLERAAFMSRDRDLTNRTLLDLARMYLKDGRVADAAEIWQQECKRSGIRNCTPWLELAKILEHRTKDLAGALTLIEDALAQARLTDELWMDEGGMAGFVADFEKRRVRISARITRVKARSSAG
jgi:uncharacterized protein